MILFISDLHLDASRPHISEAFCEFLQGPARQAEALYILGDLFELWVGDDDDSELALQVQQWLRQLADSGTALFFLPGNRDFLIGSEFARRSSAQLLPDPHPIELGSERVLLMHGDTLCTGDPEYQTFRAQVRQPDWIDGILARPLDERRAIGRQLREQSQSMNSRKAEDIMDVSAAEVRRVLVDYEADKLVHGHTHRPARHAVELPGRSAERIVLGDWDERGWLLQYDGDWDLRFWPL